MSGFDISADRYHLNKVVRCQGSFRVSTRGFAAKSYTGGVRTCPAPRNEEGCSKVLTSRLLVSRNVELGGGILMGKVPYARRGEGRFWTPICTVCGGSSIETGLAMVTAFRTGKIRVPRVQRCTVAGLENWRRIGEVMTRKVLAPSRRAHQIRWLSSLALKPGAGMA